MLPLIVYYPLSWGNQYSLSGFHHKNKQTDKVFKNLPIQYISLLVSHVYAVRVLKSSHWRISYSFGIKGTLNCAKFPVLIFHLATMTTKESLIYSLSNSKRDKFCATIPQLMLLGEPTYHGHKNVLMILGVTFKVKSQEFLSMFDFLPSI